MKTDVETLLDELLRRHARGEPLDVEGLLGEAGPDAEELAMLIDRLLERAPRQQPSEDALEYVRGLEDPPLLRARRERGLKIDAVVDAIIVACQLRPDSRGKVRRYYQMLEGGTLDPSGVADRVWTALADAIGRPMEALARSAFTEPSMPASPMYRLADARLDPDQLAKSPKTTSEPQAPDEVDELFTGERE
jgi:hypothetical protein